MNKIFKLIFMLILVIACKDNDELDISLKEESSTIIANDHQNEENVVNEEPIIEVIESILLTEDLSLYDDIIMKDAWLSAIENCPEDMVFIDGLNYMLQEPEKRWDKFPSMRNIESFYISKYEVTQSQYKEIMGNNPSEFVGKNNPVDNVSLYDAIAYCNRLSISEGLTPYYYSDKFITEVILDRDFESEWGTVYCNYSSDGFRLPTEYEWELAFVRSTNDNHNIDLISWHSDNSNDATHKVGKKEPNDLGIYDLLGNVAEWTFSFYGTYDQYLIRGGSWRNSLDISPYRDSADDNTTNNRIGFRVARNIPSQYMRYRAITFSDYLVIRDKPSIEDGEIVTTINSLTPLVIYDAAGTAEYIDGVFDFWYKISENQDKWVNAYYVTPLPFFTRSNGRVDTFSDIRVDITDDADIREHGFTYYTLDHNTKKLKYYEEATYMETDIPLFGLNFLNFNNLDIFDLERLYNLERGKTYRSIEFAVNSDNYSIENSLPPISYFDLKRGCQLSLADMYGSEPPFNFYINAYGYLHLDWYGFSNKLFEISITEQGQLMLMQREDNAVSITWYHPATSNRSKYIDESDWSGNTDLHWAASHWDDLDIMYLLREDSYINFKNIRGETPLDFLTEMHNDNSGNQYASLEYLEEAGAQYNKPKWSVSD